MISSTQSDGLPQKMLVIRRPQRRRSVGFMKFLVIAVLVGLIAFYAMQTRARLTFPDYDKINKIDEVYFAGDFRSPSACEEGLAYYRAVPGQTAQPARCRYAPRYYVWGLMAEDIAYRLAAWIRICIGRLPTIIQGKSSSGSLFTCAIW